MEKEMEIKLVGDFGRIADAVEAIARVADPGFGPRKSVPRRLAGRVAGRAVKAAPAAVYDYDAPVYDQGAPARIRVALEKPIKRRPLPPGHNSCGCKSDVCCPHQDDRAGLCPTCRRIPEWCDCPKGKTASGA